MRNNTTPPLPIVPRQSFATLAAAATAEAAGEFATNEEIRMSDISKLEMSEKSEMLVEVMGWQKVWASMSDMVLLDGKGRGLGYHTMRSGEPMPNIYLHENMPLAWACMRWLCIRDEEIPSIAGWTIADEFMTWWEDAKLYNLFSHEAQKRWLDKILELAIEAGLITP